MAKYTCSKTKDEILEIIAEEFRKVNKDYDNAMQNDNEKLKERNQGRYVAMFDLSSSMFSRRVRPSSP